MNIYEYFIKRKKLNILREQLNNCDNRIRKIHYDARFYWDKSFHNKQLDTENKLQESLKEEIKNL